MLVSDPFFRQDGSLVLREMPTDDVPHALFEDRLPQPNEVRRILSAGFGVHLVRIPPEGQDLHFLRDFAGLTHLGVAGVGYDTRGIGELSSLVTLELSVADAPETDLSGLIELRRFSGFLRPNESVLECPALVSASFQEARNGVVPPIAAQLRELTLMSAGKLQQLAPADKNPALTSLVVDGAKIFDVGSLREFPQLEFVSFMRVKDLVNIATLTELPIRELGLFECGRIDKPETLRGLRDVTVGVEGKLSKELRRVSEGSPSHWEFYH